MLAQVRRLLLHVVEESAQRAPVHPREAGDVALAAPADEVTQALRDQRYVLGASRRQVLHFAMSYGGYAGARVWARK